MERRSDCRITSSHHAMNAMFVQSPGLATDFAILIGTILECVVTCSSRAQSGWHACASYTRATIPRLIDLEGRLYFGRHIFENE